MLACGERRGLELGRCLRSEWCGSAPQVIAAKARHFQDPVRRHDVKKLLEALPVWEQLGSEVALGGHPVSDWVKAQAVDKLMPLDMLNTAVGHLGKLCPSQWKATSPRIKGLYVRPGGGM
jgi:hypothetical protein